MNTRNIFKQFVQASDLPDILETFNALIVLAGLQYSELFEKLKHFYYNDNRALWDLLVAKKEREEYRTKDLANKQSRLLIVGSGPGGLCAAIESYLLGGKPFIIEKRISFNRNNILLLWDYTVDYLKSMGAKLFFSKFCVNALHHISIRQLQCIMLKICLLFGIPFECDIALDSVHYYSDESDQYWVADVTKGSSNEQQVLTNPATQKPFKLNGLIGADGLNSKVSQIGEFEKTVLKAKRAIGITFNFINTNTSKEVFIEEFAASRQYKQQWFKDLKNEGFDLENCVYYRGETHYFVCTISKNSLVDAHLLKSDKETTEELLHPSNRNAANLANFAQVIRKRVNLPDYVEFKKAPNGSPDIQLFDFTRKLAAKQQFKFIKADESPENALFVALVGDALVEPFWPQGTGASRAILSAQDAIFAFSKYSQTFKTQHDQNLLIDESTQKIYPCLFASSNEKIHKQCKKTQMDKVGTIHYSGCTFDPITRYVNLRL